MARAYLAAVRADADVEAAKANVALSEAVLKQAEDQKAAGTGTGIEITRAQGAAGERPAAAAGGGERAARGATCNCCARSACGWTRELELTDRLAVSCRWTR